MFLFSYIFILVLVIFLYYFNFILFDLVGKHQISSLSKSNLI